MLHETKQELIKNNDDFKLLSLKGARKLLGISHESTRKLAEEGIIGSVKIKDIILVPLCKLKEFIEESSLFLKSNSSKKNVYQEDAEDQDIYRIFISFVLKLEAGMKDLTGDRL